MLSRELRVAIVERLVRLFIQDNESLNNGVSLRLDHLVEVEVVELRGQVADVQRRQSFLFRGAGLRPLRWLLLGLIVAHQLLHLVKKHHLLWGYATQGWLRLLAFELLLDGLRYGRHRLALLCLVLGALVLGLGCHLLHLRGAFHCV